MTVPKYIEYAVRFLDQYKSFFGFADWSLRVDDKTEKEQPQDNTANTVAEVEYDYFKKELTITLYKDYLKSDSKDEELIHELIHARIGIASEQTLNMIDRIQYLNEEQAVNDITRGFMKMLSLKSENDKYINKEE